MHPVKTRTQATYSGPSGARLKTGIARESPRHVPYTYYFRFGREPSCHWTLFRSTLQLMTARHSLRSAATPLEPLVPDPPTQVAPAGSLIVIKTILHGEPWLLEHPLSTWVTAQQACDSLPPPKKKRAGEKPPVVQCRNP